MVKPKIFEEVDEEMAREKYLEENVENTVRCPICGAVLLVTTPTLEDVEEEETD